MAYILTNHLLVQIICYQLFILINKYCIHTYFYNKCKCVSILALGIMLVGDTILYGKYAGTEITVEGKEYLIMRESDIFAIV